MARIYQIEFTQTAYAHLEVQRRYDRNVILDAIREQLGDSPAEETHDRKLLRSNPLADWELRIGPFRVFYDVDADICLVRILMVGVKQGNRLFIGGKEVVL